MTKGLERFYGKHDLHFITCSCYRRQRQLNTPARRDLLNRPEDWRWSSFRAYAYGDLGIARVNCQEWPLEIKYTHSFENRE